MKDKGNDCKRKKREREGAHQRRNNEYAVNERNKNERKTISLWKSNGR